MTRTTLFLDRLATLVLAAVLIALGLLGLVWWDGRWLQLPDRIDAASVTNVIDMAWWPWASAAVGVLLALVGLRWIAAHLASRRVKALRLTGSDKSGRLGVDANHVADAAADSFADTLGVRSAGGAIERDRGRLVAHLTATIEPTADLELIAQSADRVSAQLQEVLQRNDLRCSVELKVASRARSLPRVS